MLYDIMLGHAPTVYGAINGDLESINALGEDFKVVLQIAAELIESLKIYLSNLSDFEAGRFLGRIIGEGLLIIAEAAFTAGVGAVVTKATLIPRLTAKLRTISTFADVPEVLGRLDWLDNLALRLEGSGMCFPTGTPVRTDRGVAPIESLGPGDMVLSADRERRRTHSRVRNLIVTAPAALTLLTFSFPEASAGTTLTCTPQHPIWVEEAAAFVPAGELAPGDHVLLHDGARAELTRTISRTAPPGCRFTTWNIEVEGTETYFAGDPGILVHNTGKICQEAAATFERIRETSGKRGWEAFEDFLDATDTPGTPGTGHLDSHLRQVLNTINKEALEDAILPDGSIDWTRVRTAKDLDRLKADNPRLRNQDLHVHHIIPKYVARILLKELRPDWSTELIESKMDDIPAMLIHKKDHIGIDDEGAASLHRILTKGVDPVPNTGQRLHKARYDAGTIMRKLETSYTQWGSQEAWVVAKEWLKITVGQSLAP